MRRTNYKIFLCRLVRSYYKFLKYATVLHMNLFKFNYPSDEERAVITEEFNRPYKDLHEFLNVVEHPKFYDDELSDAEEGSDWITYDNTEKCLICAKAEACNEEGCNFSVVDKNFDYGCGGRSVLCCGRWCHNCMSEYAIYLHCDACGALRPWEHPDEPTADHCICPSSEEICAYCDPEEPYYSGFKNNQDDGGEEYDEEAEEGEPARYNFYC